MSRGGGSKEWFMSDSELKIIDVKMSTIEIATNPHILRTSGIGSCVVITLYDSTKRIGAMAHPMLAIKPAYNTEIPLRFVENAIDAMIMGLEKIGALRKLLEAKIIGGANMFKVLDKNPNSIGAENVESAVKKLESEGIKIVATDTGGNCGRSVEFDLITGLVEVKTKI